MEDKLLIWTKIMEETWLYVISVYHLPSYEVQSEKSKTLH